MRPDTWSWEAYLGLIGWLFFAVLGILGAASARQLTDEFKAWTPWLIKRFIQRAVRQLPKNQRKRCMEEWQSMVDEIPGEVGKIIVAFGFLSAPQKMSSDAADDVFLPSGKRIIDIGFAAFAIIFLSPLFFIVWLLIAAHSLDPPGPIFVRNRRHACNKTIYLWGFRTVGTRVTLAEGKASHAEILGGQNFGFAIDCKERLDLARRAMEWHALPTNQPSKGRNCVKNCLHASLSWGPGQNPTKEEMKEAAQSFLKSLGMEDALAVFIAHNDRDHRHVHVIASRINAATGKAYARENDFAKRQAWAQQWERERGQIAQHEGRQGLHKVAEAIAACDVAAIIAILTQWKPTFTAWELARALSYGTLNEEWAKFFADWRVREYRNLNLLLRRSGIDRLPQLFNVLSGEISLVGPRPLPSALNKRLEEQFPAFMRRRQSVKPGIFGLADVKGVYSQRNPHEMLQSEMACDLDYIVNRSFWFDLKILLTICFIPMDSGEVKETY